MFSLFDDITRQSVLDFLFILATSIPNLKFLALTNLELWPSPPLYKVRWRKYAEELQKNANWTFKIVKLKKFISAKCT